MNVGNILFCYNETWFMSLVMRFDEIGFEDTKQVGGKAINLGKLFNNGFQVPNGFVLTAFVFHNFMIEHSLIDVIAELIKKITVKVSI